MDAQPMNFGSNTDLIDHLTTQILLSRDEETDVIRGKHSFFSHAA